MRVDPGFHDLTHVNGRSEAVKYVLFVPHGRDLNEAQPLILYLHGAGETGDDGRRQTAVGLGPVVRAREKEFPFYVLFPQSRRGSWRAGSSDVETVLELLVLTQKQAAIDANRIYLTGISMGGFGTFSLATAHPELWAAIVPVCGGGNSRHARRIAAIPCWCFHGAEDDIVPATYSREMITALREAGGSPIYDEMPGVKHNSWDRAYAKPELFEWLLQQRRSPD